MRRSRGFTLGEPLFVLVVVGGVFMALSMTGCVDERTALDYARRAHPECERHRVQAHRLGGESQSEIEMVCDGKPRTIAVKCVFGWGVISDTTCHENN